MNEPFFTIVLILLSILFAAMILKVLCNAGAKNSTLAIITIIFSCWLLIIFNLLLSGFFSATGTPQVAFAISVFMPVVFGLMAQKLSPTFAATIANISTASFLRLQQMRAAFGVMFFFTGSLPVWFQYTGGLGDIAAGITAFTALAYYQAHPKQEQKAIIRGNFTGILDFVVVLNLGLFVVLQNNSPDIMFSLIPLFAVPIFILLHIFSLQKLPHFKNSLDSSPASNPVHF